jgi:hypothetical protein
VRGEMIADDAAKLVVVQIVEVIEILEIARHACTCLR